MRGAIASSVGVAIASAFFFVFCNGVFMGVLLYTSVVVK